MSFPLCRIIKIKFSGIIQYLLSIVLCENDFVKRANKKEAIEIAPFLFYLSV